VLESVLELLDLELEVLDMGPWVQEVLGLELEQVE